MTLVAIALGGALGSVLRYLMAGGVQQLFSRPFPLGTLSVNVAGCLLIGLLYVALLEKAVSAPWRLFWIVGVLGGFTTFSSFSFETFGLMSEGAYGRALLNVALSVLLCLAATWLGMVLGRQL
jgi:CrcB protein